MLDLCCCLTVKFECDLWSKIGHPVTDHGIILLERFMNHLDWDYNRIGSLEITTAGWCILSHIEGESVGYFGGQIYIVCITFFIKKS